MERKIKLVPYRVYKYCPKCPGTMEQCNWGIVLVSSSTGLTWTSTGPSSPPKEVSNYSITNQNFNHRCTKCGHGENYDKSYPYIDYIEDGELG
jgi:hypothetical protein